MQKIIADTGAKIDIEDDGSVFILTTDQEAGDRALAAIEGLVHISKFETRRVAKVEDVVSEGDEIKVKLMEIDRQGKFNLYGKDALSEEAASEENAQ
ncbi:MAG: S1 RNA-binding domain-containing protein [Clostridia bacterium]|nr:S1 RNA-binding domain-containing protein [Clostridia bacterium]